LGAGKEKALMCMVKSLAMNLQGMIPNQRINSLLATFVWR